VRKRRTLGRHEDIPFGDVDHPREQFDKICPRSTRIGHALIENTDVFHVLVVLDLQRGVVIYDRHSRRSSGALKKLLQSSRIFQKCRSKKDALLTKDHMIATNCQFRKAFVSGAARSAPTVSKKGYR
jgi:hypothetical protein